MKILIADDEKIQRIFMKKLIETIFPTVIIYLAEDGNQAIEKVIENDGSIDLIMMDLTMPNCDGIEATETIRMINPDILIYIISAFGEDKDIKDKCNAVNVTGYFSKPLTKNMIKDIMNR